MTHLTMCGQLIYLESVWSHRVEFLDTSHSAIWQERSLTVVNKQGGLLYMGHQQPHTSLQRGDWSCATVSLQDLMEHHQLPRVLLLL